MSRSELTRYRSLTVIFSALRFPSHPVAAQEMKVKAKIRGTAEQSADALLGNEYSRKPYSNADLLGERKSKSTGRSCSLKSTRRHIRAKDRRSSHQWSIFWKKKTLCASRRFYFLRVFSIDFLNNFLLLYRFVIWKCYDCFLNFILFYLFLN